MSNLINLPNFIFTDKDLSNASKIIKKLTLLIKGNFLIFLYLTKQKINFFVFS